MPGREPDILAEFAEEARKLIRVSGGLNATSLAKIRRKGRGLGLTDAQVDEVVAQVRAARPSATSPQAEAFRRRLGALLDKADLPAGGLLNPVHVGRLEAIGRQKHGLGPTEAAEVVREVARERGLRRLTPEAAEAAFREQVEATRAVGPITPAKRKGLLRFAATLGVARDRAATILADGVEMAWIHPEEVRKDNGRFLALVIGSGVMAVMVFLLAMSFVEMSARAPASPPALPAAGGNPASEGPKGPTSPPAEGPQAAWNSALEGARDVFRYPADEAILDGLASSDEALRLGALRSLMLRLDGHLRTDAERESLARLLAASLAAEPSDEFAAVVREAIHRALTEPLDPESRGAAAIDRAYWALATALLALRQPGLGRSRVDELVATLADLLGDEATLAAGVAAESEGEADASASRLRERVGTVYYRALIDRAPVLASSPGFAEGREALARHLGSDLTPEARARLDAEFLTAALGSAGSGWRNYLGLIAACLDSGDPRAVEAIIDLYRSTANTELRDQLDFELRHRLGGGVNLEDEEAVAEAFRKRGKPARGRREQFREKADAALAAAREGGASAGPGRVLEQVVALATASSLGCALASGDAGSDEFDALLKGPEADPSDASAGSNSPLPATGGPPFARGRRRATFGRAGPRDHDELIRTVARGQPFERMTAWRMLGQAGLPDELPDDQAAVIARYILWGGKSAQEGSITTSGLHALTRPRAVRLALADLLGEVTPLPRRFDLIGPPIAERFLGIILGRDVKLGTLSWREEARRLLVADVLRELEPDLDAAVARFRALYLAQGRLLGLGEGDDLLTARPSQMIEVVANHLAGRLEARRASLGEAEKAALDRVPHEVAAADYLAEDELQRAVLMQRAWLRVLAVHVAAERPARADSARRIAEGDDPGEAGSQDVLEQLRSGEVQALRLWMLLNDLGAE